MIANSQTSKRKEVSMCGCGSAQKSISSSPKVGCGCRGAASPLGATPKGCGCGCGGAGGCAETLGSTKKMTVLRGVNQGHQYAPSAVPAENGGSSASLVGVATLGALCIALTLAIQKLSD